MRFLISAALLPLGSPGRTFPAPDFFANTMRRPIYIAVYRTPGSEPRYVRTLNDNVKDLRWWLGEEHACGPSAIEVLYFQLASKHAEQEAREVFAGR